MTEALYLCVHVPEFAAQALLRLRGELKAQAVAVVEGVAPLERVCSVNRRAAAKGVRAGMTKAELDSFDGLALLRRSEEEERAAKTAVMEVAGAFTPRVQDLTAAHHATGQKGIDGACVVVLDVSGTDRLFGPVEHLAGRLAVALRELALVARMAVSGNLFTAVVVARAMAAGQVRVVARGEEAAELASLPVEVLMLTEAQAETFATWGLRTLGELAELAEVEVVVRLGQEGGRLWRLASGQAEHLLVPVEAGLRLEEVVEFDTPVDAMESLMFMLGPMLDQLIARAGNRALELASVRVEMGLEAHGGGDEGDGGSGCGGEHVRLIKPALPMSDRLLYLKLLHLDLEAHPPGAAVVRLRLTAEAGGRSKVQAGLFRPPLPESGRLEVTLARLAGLVGESWVGRARLRDSHAPGSFAMERFRLPEVEAARRSGRGRARQDRLLWQTGEMRRRQMQASATNTRDVGQVREPAAATGRTVEVTNIRIGTTDPAERRTNVEDAESAAERAGQVRSNVHRFTVLRKEAWASTGVTGQARENAGEEGASAGDVEGERGASAEPRYALAVRRMRPPVPIRWKGEGEITFWMQGVLFEVRERYGPWRRSGAWWTGEVWSQEEWDVTVEAGGGVRLLCVLTHDLLRDRWHLDAIYD